MIRIKNKKAQQLVEFLLIAPVLIIILGILTEYAYALNINMTLTKALKTVTASIYSEIKPSMSKSDIVALVKTDLNKYLSDNNVPTLSENNITVSYVINNSTAIFMASYTYLTAFTLPNMWFKFLPDKFLFFTTAAVPSTFLSDNNYNSAITSAVLDNIWSSTASFSSQDAFNASKKGVMKQTAGRENILFLVSTTDPTSTLKTPYALVTWDGIVKTDTATGNTFMLDMDNGGFYTCSATACPNYSKTFYNYIISKDYYNVFFVSKTDISDTSNLATDWLNPAQEDISDTSVQGALKNILSVTKNNMSVGNYDNLKVSTYNTSVSGGNTYTMKPYGSFILLYSTEDITKINATVKSKNYDFGS